MIQLTIPNTAPAGITTHSSSNRMPSISQSATIRATALKAQSSRMRFTRTASHARPDGAGASARDLAPVAVGLVPDEGQAGVVAAEAEGVGDDRVDARRPRGEDVVERRLGVGLVQVQGRRQHPAAEG